MNKIEFDVAGTNHCPDIKKCKNLIRVNDKLLLELEPQNKSDENAIKILLNKENKIYRLGYVPRYYAKELKELLINNTEYSAMIQSMNFESNISDEYITAFLKLLFAK